MTTPWRTISRRVLLDRQPWFTVGEEIVELPDGRVVEDFNWIAMREFAIVVPILEDGRTILIRSYKHGVRAVSLSCPAGYLEAGEPGIDGAKRELLEETGHAATRWIALGRFVVDGNYGSGAMHAFVATGAHGVRDPASGDLEEQELMFLPFAEALAKLRAGEIAQLSTAAALGLAEVALA